MPTSLGNVAPARPADALGLAFQKLSSMKEDREMSSMEMREFLLFFLNALSQLASTMVECSSKRALWDVDINKHVIDASDKQLQEVIAKTNEYLVKKRESAKWSVVAKIFGGLLTALTLVFSLATGNVGLFVGIVMVTTLQESGALEKLGNAISEACGANKLESFFIKIALVVAICAITGGIAGIGQGTKAAGEEASVEMVNMAGEGTAAAAAETSSSIAKILQHLVKALASPEGRMMFTQSFSSSFMSTGALNDLIVYCTEVYNKDASAEEKKKREERLELIIGLVVEVALAVCCSATAYQGLKSSTQVGYTGKLGQFLKKAQDYLQYGNGLTIGDTLATLGNAVANTGKGVVKIQQGKSYEKLTDAQASQEFLLQIMRVISQMVHQNQARWKGVSEEVGSLQQTQIKPNQDPDKRFADLLAAIAG